MHSRIFSENPLAGIRRIWHSDADVENFTIETQQNVSPILENNAAIMSHKADRHTGRMFDPKAFATHVASIPVSEYFRLKREGIIGGPNGETILDDERFVKYLNDRDNLKLRTNEGRL